jgi:ABC-type bacteriocin/lantibiotic exporter with double-glycine peptidase domain
MSYSVTWVPAFLGLCVAAQTVGDLWLDVPFVSQEKHGCGAASAAMVMRYWQRQQGRPESADAARIHRALYSAGARGTFASDLEGYLREQGFRTFTIKGEWQDLKHHLEKGRPLMVALKTGRADLHYVVVTGLNRKEEIVLKHDPAVRKLLQQRRAEFEKEWKAAGNWTLLALPESSP